MKNLFLPVSKQDFRIRGWKEPDVILVSGDAYVDHPSYGTAVIGRMLEDSGFKVGIIAQPDWRKPDDFLEFGRPRLFFGITAGNLDSMLANYTASKKPRREDEYSPGGKAGLRPNRAVIVYANRLRELFPGVPLVLGGIEASLRRLAHYCYWDDAVRRSVLLDAKADILVYGMGEKPVTEIAVRLRCGEKINELNDIRGTVVARSGTDGFENAVTIPSFDETKADSGKFNEAFTAAYREADPFRGRTVIQKHGDRFVIQLPPPLPLAESEMDRIYELPYLRAWHPAYDRAGGVPGFETVKFSVVSHRGCSAECSFCSLYSHQGRMIQSRSRKSILREVRLLAAREDFRGTITDIGGPTANLYAASCEKWAAGGACRDRQCLMPGKCANLRLGYDEAIALWEEVLAVPGVKHLFVSSGLRYDLLIEKYSDAYLKALCEKHVSGRLKVAPEHCVPSVLEQMNKTPFSAYEKFVRRFKEMNKALGKEQYLVNYLISAHPGAGLNEALDLALCMAKRHARPEQVQDFIPLPMTASACMYHTGRNPFTGEKVYAAKSYAERQMQRALLQPRQEKNRKWVLEALSRLNRRDLQVVLCGHSFRGKR
ncbi:MAG TPA: YgiQ family radical SAM protein [Candidatus Omnitrophota bacterium]|nr:YgiQ family radical SAM protein [Candidatus Omnitrophota bacterium]